MYDKGGVFRVAGSDNIVLSTHLAGIGSLLLSHMPLFSRTDSTERNHLKNEGIGQIQCPLFLKGRKTPLAL